MKSTHQNDCETNCQKACETNCQKACETNCQKACETNCEKASETNTLKASALSLSAYKAFFYAFFAGVCFSMNSVLVRFARGTSPLQMSLYRFMGMTFCNLPIVVYKEVSFIGPKGSRKVLLYRVAAAVPTVIFSFISFRYLPIGEASVIVYSTPVFVTIFARFLLKESCGVVQSVTVGLAVLGIILIINPSTILSVKNLQATDHITGVLFGLAGLVCHCAMLILTRQTRNVHYSVVCFQASTAGTILCFLLLVTAYNLVLPGCGVMRWVALAMGLSSSLGQIFYVKALQTENVGPISTLKAAADITIAVAWQVGIFQETLDDFAIAGTSLVVISVLLIGLRKWVLMLPKASPLKKTFQFLTY